MSAGRPIGMAAVPVSGVRGPTVSVVQSTVVSVGPYTLTVSYATSGCGRVRSTSPPSSRWRSGGCSAGGRESRASPRAVGRIEKVTRSRAYQRASVSGSVRTVSSAMTTEAPAVSAGQISRTDASKLWLHTSALRSAEVKAKRLWCHWQRSTTLRCGTATPLGVPVLPEV